MPVLGGLVEELVGRATQEPAHRGPGLVITAVVLGSLAVLTVALRIWLRAGIQRNANVSDWFMVGALVMTLAYLIETCIAVQAKGLNRHSYNLAYDEIPTALIHTFAVTMIALWAGYAVRMSILLFYRHVFSSHPNTLIRHFLLGLGIFLTLQFLASVLTFFLDCRPLSDFWVPGPASSKPTCIDQGAFIISFGIISCVADLILTLIPIGVIHNMQLPAPQKLALWALFCLGLTSTAAAAIRAYWGYFVFYTAEGGADYTWWSYNIFFWTCVELPVAITCASAVTLRGLFVRFLNRSGWKLSSSLRRTRGTSRSKSNYSPENTYGKSAGSGMLQTWDRNSELEMERLFQLAGGMAKGDAHRERETQEAGSHV